MAETTTRLASTRFSKAQLLAAQGREIAMSRNLYRRMIASGVSDAKRAELYEQYALKLAIQNALILNLSTQDVVGVDPSAVRTALQADSEKEVSDGKAN